MTIPSYMGANTVEADKVRRRAGEARSEVVRSAPNTGHRFGRAAWTVARNLAGLALFIIAAATCAVWFAVVTGR